MAHEPLVEHYDYTFLVCNDIRYLDSTHESIDSIYPICTFRSTGNESTIISNLLQFAWKKQDSSIPDDVFDHFEMPSVIEPDITSIPIDHSSVYNHMQIFKLYYDTPINDPAWFKPFLKNNKRICVFIHHELKKIICATTSIPFDKSPES